MTFCSPTNARAERAKRARLDDEPHPQSDMDNVVQYGTTMLQPVDTGACLRTRRCSPGWVYYKYGRRVWFVLQRDVEYRVQ